VTRVDNTLDLVLIDDCKCVLSVKIFELFSTSDHSRVRFDVLHMLPTGRPSHSHSVRDFSRANWEQIQLFLNIIDLYDVFHDDISAQDVVNNFYNIINDCHDRFVPTTCSKLYAKAQSLNYPYCVRKKSAKRLKCGEFMTHFTLVSR
jgi:hypothetical protein